MEAIECIEFKVRDNKVLTTALTCLFNICKAELSPSLMNKLSEDFDHFVSNGKWYIHNSYNGGFLFIREPEKILEIRLNFSSDKDVATAVVEFDNEIRNQRNVKYNPNVGKIDQNEWPLNGVFPHFRLYPKPVKIYLISALAKIGKEICEDRNRNSWYMKYTSDFNIRAILDEEEVDSYHVTCFNAATDVYHSK